MNEASWMNRRLVRGLGVCAAAALALVVAGAQAAKPPAQQAIKAPLASSSWLMDVAATRNGFVTVGERGHILVSSDAGATWTQADVPTRALLTGVFMVDDQLGWAVGHDAVILRTRDGGKTWALVHADPDAEKPLLDVWFADATHGLAVGAYGTLLATADGGDTWEARAVLGEDDFHLNQVAAAPDGALYLAAEAGHLYRSEDRGTTWQALVSPYEGSWSGVLALPDGSLVAYGLRGHVYRSSDRGATWTAIPTGSEETVTSAVALGGPRFAAAGMAGRVLWSDASGTAVRTQDLDGRKAIVAVARASADTLLLFGESGVKTVTIPR